MTASHPDGERDSVLRDAPSGLPPDETEAQPLGVPADADPHKQEPGPDAMPGIPTEGDAPAAS